ncbi:hypothetical protein ACFL31_02190 [Candidatus Margulisiibacteriota bacterium]
MQITKIDEANQTTVSQEVRMKKLGGKVCLCYPKIMCTAPTFKFAVCKTCPRAALFFKKNAVSSLFERIKAMAIMLMNIGNSIAK